MNRFSFGNFKFFAMAATLVALCAQMFLNGILAAHASYSVGSVVINEIAWAGSPDNSNDEWIELYNTTSSAIDLAGWYIEDDYTAQYVIQSGIIPSKGYFLIENSEDAVSNVSADAIIALSLANTGDSLILKTPTNVVIDSVNSSGGAWYAGNNTTKATMERIDPSITVDSATNFSSAVNGNGAKSSGGSSIIGTPKGQNSVYQGSSGSASINFDLSNENPLNGQEITATVIVTNATDLFAYGFDVVYDSSVLSFSGAVEDGFLSGNGQVSTAFNAALENGAPGKIIIGNARLVSPAHGVSGSGNLFTLKFNVSGQAGAKSDLVFGGGSFLSDSSGDILATMTKASVEVSSNTANAISGLSASPGNDIYSLTLGWSEPSGGANSYIIYRKAVNGSFVQIGTSLTTNFIDANAIIPGITYEYQVRAVKNGIQSASVATTGVETRGLVGDNNRSGRVDGRDVENLARHYGSVFGSESYNPTVDTTYDGLVDGSDLIDIGANFGFSL